jgi:peroxiredoxin
MKNKRQIEYFCVFLLGFFSLSLQAQLPEKAEDIAPLLIGEQIPNRVLRTATGAAVSTDSLFEGKRSILIFYRGGWCPYCSLHLSEVGKNEEALLDLGYQIVAVSPDAPAALQATASKQELPYALLSDSQGEFMEALGIAFQAPEKHESILAKGSEGQNTHSIPVASLFIIDETRTILFEYINPDYKTRISSNLLMAVAQALSRKDGKQTSTTN